RGRFDREITCAAVALRIRRAPARRNRRYSEVLRKSGRNASLSGATAIAGKSCQIIGSSLNQTSPAEDPKTFASAVGTSSGTDWGVTWKASSGEGVGYAGGG